MWDKERWHTFPSFCVSDGLSLANSVANEGVGSLAAKSLEGYILLGVSAGLASFSASPEVLLALLAVSSVEAQLLECLNRVKLLRVSLELRLSQLLYFLSSLMGREGCLTAVVKLAMVFCSSTSSSASCFMLK